MQHSASHAPVATGSQTPEPTVLQTMTPAANPLCMTWAKSTASNGAGSRIPRISLADPKSYTTRGRV